MLTRFFCSAAVAVCLLLLPLAHAAETTKIKVTSRGDDNAKYAIAMLNLALKKIGKPYDVTVVNEALSSPKLREELVTGNIDVIWAAASMDMEENALPVRVPLFKGLLGHRVLLIHKDNANLFDHVETYDQALEFTYGQGKGWPDTTILEANGVTVVPANKYEGLFYMVDGKRFDAFPRGVHEPWGEIEKRPDLELTVDRNLMFVYQMPFYLVVSPERPQLAADLEKGLLMAIDDGSFDELFFNNPMVKMVLEKGNLKERRIFTLKNPELPPKTPLDNPKLWVDVKTL